MSLCFPILLGPRTLSLDACAAKSSRGSFGSTLNLLLVIAFGPWAGTNSRPGQLWVGADGVTHIDEHECGKLETKDFTSTGGDAALQYVRAFSDSDDFALTGLVVTQQVGENPWHYCPSPQFVVTLEGSWYIRTSDGKTTTFRPGGSERCPFRNAAMASCTRALRHRRDAPRRNPTASSRAATRTTIKSS